MLELLPHGVEGTWGARVRKQNVFVHCIAWNALGDKSTASLVISCEGFFFLSGRGGDALVGIIHFVIRGDNNLPTVPLDCK